MKLHLGCGENYLKGYVNIDFSRDKHTVQEKGVADRYADILKLRFNKSSIEEIRLHHVFEHFERPVACALLTCWAQWLKEGGRLLIEVPDFSKSAAVVINRGETLKKKLIALRHIFGSHEASWAHHYEGWDPEILSKLIEELGFKISRVAGVEYMGIYSFSLIARKKISKTRQEYFKVVEEFLSNFLVDNSSTEKKIYEIWLRRYEQQLDNCWPEE